MVLPEMVQVLNELAWQKLGLRIDPMTNEIHRDLNQAKICIDAVAALAGVMIPHLDATDQAAMNKLVTDLRLNYVNQSEVVTK